MSTGSEENSLNFRKLLCISTSAIPEVIQKVSYEKVKIVLVRVHLSDSLFNLECSTNLQWCSKFNNQ